MKKSEFYFKIFLYIVLVVIPLFVLGLGLFINGNGSGFIVGGIAAWGVLAYFAYRLYGFINLNKDMLISQQKNIHTTDNFSQKKQTQHDKYIIEGYKIGINPHKISIHWKTLEERLISKYHFENSETINFLCDIIKKATAFYNQENKTNLYPDNVADKFFVRFARDISKLSVDDVKNNYFGFFGYISAYCILLSDNAYDKMRNHNETFEKLEFSIEGHTSSELKKKFLSIMDDCYIDWHISKLDEVDSLNELSGQLNGDDLFLMAISRFKKEYSLNDDSFIKTNS